MESPEIKQAMQSESLLDRMMSDPALSQLFMDPECQQILNMFSQHPQEALKHYQHRPDIVEALKSVAGHFGNHFTALADEQEKDKKQKGSANSRSTVMTPVVTIPEDLPAHEKELVRRVMRDQAVQDALKDERVQEIMMTLRTRPQDYTKVFQKYVNVPDMKPKIQKLIDIGLLQWSK